MRRLLLAVSLLTALIVAGCGSSSSSGSSPLISELSYFPTNSPFVLSVQTDPNSGAVQQAEQLVAQFPYAAFGEAALKSKLAQLGINYATDVKPLFGNPLLFGFPGIPTGGAAGRQVLVVWTTKDSGALSSLLKKVLHGTSSSGSRDGATLYQLGTAELAVDGATLALSPDASVLNAALDRHAHGGGFSNAQYTRALSGLPQNALIQAFGDIAGLLSSPRAAKARQVPWVAALRTYAATISASGSGITIQYRVDSSGASLSGSQLPIAGGSTPPSLAGTLPIAVALKNPAQSIAFLQAAEQATGAASYQKFLARESAARRKTGTDVTALFPLLTGDAILESDTHSTLARIGLSDPGSAAGILAKLAADPQAWSSTATSITRVGSLYAVNESRPTLIGVVGNQFVIGERTTPAALSAFAAAPTTPASGAQGALAFRISLPALIQIALKQSPPKVLQTVLSSLGDLTGWTAASTGALTGTASLALK